MKSDLLREGSQVVDAAPLHPPYPQTAVHADGHPVGEHLLDHGLCAPQHELRVLGGRGIDEVYQQLFHDACVVLELAVERDGQQGGQAAPVCRRGASALATPHDPGIWGPLITGEPVQVDSRPRKGLSQDLQDPGTDAGGQLSAQRT